ncbi:hypothetical protein ACWEV3_10970 [Saccharopolyspora sp. NPDC003752]
MKFFSKKQPQEYLVGDSSKGGRRREELTCPGHKPHYGEQVTGMTVRWHCECGAYRDEIDAPPPHGADMPSGDYLEMRVRGLQGDTGPWRSQVTGKPLPTGRSKTAKTPEPSSQQQSVSEGSSAMAGIEDIRIAISSTSDKSGQIQAALAQVKEWAGEIAGHLNTALGQAGAHEVQQVIGAFQELSGQRIDELHQLVSGAVSEIEQYGQRL